jgi:hypothetical protein
MAISLTPAAAAHVAPNAKHACGCGESFNV